jgi:hypothetical protein
MNASDIIKAKQNKNLFYAYYKPTVFYGASNAMNTLVNTNITTSFISSIEGGDTSSTICSTLNYSYKCFQPNLSYQLANDINNGKYLCEYPYCSTITSWNSNETHITATCNCKISELSWKADKINGTINTFASNSNTNSAVLSSSQNSYSVKPFICSNPVFYQGPVLTKDYDTCNE